MLASSLRNQLSQFLFFKYDMTTYGKNIEKIFIQGLLLCIVGSIESLMTSEVVEAYVKTPSDGQRTITAMGVGNIISGFFGGMGGNAMIGLSTINVLCGGRGRLAPTVVALVVFSATVGAYPLLNYIPVSALAGIMLVVVLHTFKWFSLKMLLCAFLPKTARDKLGLKSKVPRVEVAVIVIVTLMSIFLNIAYSVLLGVAICAIAFAWNAQGSFSVTETVVGDTKYYDVEGPLFFTTANLLIKKLNPDKDAEAIIEVRFGVSTCMDYTAIQTMHKIAMSYKAQKKTLTFRSVNASSQKLVDKANDLVSCITVTPGEPLKLTQKYPTLEDGFGGNPAAVALKEIEVATSAQGERQLPEEYSVYI